MSHLLAGAIPAQPSLATAMRVWYSADVAGFDQAIAAPREVERR